MRAISQYTVPQILDAVKHKNVKILAVDIKKNYLAGEISVFLSLRLFHKGSTDKISQTVTESLERSELRMKQLSWRSGRSN